MASLIFPRQQSVRFGLTLAVLAGCGSSPSSTSPPSTTAPLPQPTKPGEHVVTKVADARLNRDLDILFMIDNSASMVGLQSKLLATFPVFVNALSGIPGGLPNLHLGVVSSDMGAGPTAISADCRVGGDGGRFQTAPRVAGCMTGLPAGQNFLSVVDGKPNFQGPLASAFSCIAALGDQGCGYEHQFASMLKALEPNGLPDTNVNFLRPSAYLAIVLLTNEDDCSAPSDSMLFDPASRSVSDPLGPLTSFRCNEFGHLCGGKKPPRTPAVLDDCTSAEDGKLLKVSEVIERTKALKGGDLGKILVSAIAGPPTPYQVVLTPGTTSTGAMEDQPSIKHSCVAEDMTSGDPGVRIKMWVDAFHGTFTTICDRTFEPAINQIVNAIGTAMGPACVEGKVVDADPLTPGLQPDCSFATVTIDAQGNKTKTALPSCEKSGGVRPCWSVSSDTQRCAGTTGAPQTLLTMVSDGPLPADVAQYEIACAVCDPGVSSGDGCRY